MDSAFPIHHTQIGGSWLGVRLALTALLFYYILCFHAASILHIDIVSAPCNGLDVARGERIPYRWGCCGC